MDKQKRTAIVTGGNRGIGFEVCRQLALLGYRVVLTSRKVNQGLEAVEQLKRGGALSSPADAARRVLAYLARPDFGQHPVADVREVLGA